MKKRYLVLLCGLALCLAANAQGAVLSYAPSADHIHYDEDGFFDVYNMGFNNNDQCLISSFGAPGTVKVISSAGHTVDLTMTMASGSHPFDAIQDASGNYVVPMNDSTIQRFQSDGTPINTWSTLGLATNIAEDDDGYIWTSENPVTGMVLRQYDPSSGTVLQTFSSTAGLPQRGTIDFVGGLHMYDGLMYVADGGRMIKFDPADPAGTVTEAIAAMDYWGGNFWEVAGMDIGADGRIYVLENVNNTVKIYDATLPANANYVQTISDPLLDESMAGVGVDATGTVFVGENGAWPNVMKFEVVDGPVDPGMFGLVINTTATAWADYNNDGFPDMFGDGKVWTNNQDGTFTQTAPFVVTNSISLGDYNNDGFIDLFGYISGESGGGPRLWTNNAGAGWTDHATKFQSTTPVFINRAITVGDFTGDGYLDTYVTGWCDPWLGPPEEDVIFTSAAGATFTETWDSTPSEAHSIGVTTIDFDEDADLDIYVSNYWQTANFLWRNDNFDGSSSGLTDVAGSYNNNTVLTGRLDDTGHGVGSCFGDFDNDGDFDLCISNFAHPGNPVSRFMENLGDPCSFYFRDRGQCGFVQLEPWAAATIADFDNDGHLDVFITTYGGYDPPYDLMLYRNNGDWTFTDVAGDVGLGSLGPSEKAAWGDLNDDGYLDLIANGQLWQNGGGSNHYLKVKLTGGPHDNGLVNGSAIGAQVRIYVPGLGMLTRQVEGSTGTQGMQNDQTLHFGLGEHGATVNLDIFWPNGYQETVYDVAVDETIEISIVPACPTADVTGDCFVDLNDLAAIALQWLQGTAP